MSIIAILLLVVLFLIISYLLYQVQFGEKRKRDKQALQKRQTDYNKAYTCRGCSVSYRAHQLDPKERDYATEQTCPHCKDKHTYRRAEDEVYYPFAPKLTLKETRKLIAHEEKMREMDKKLKEAARIEKELIAYQALEEQKITEMKR